LDAAGFAGLCTAYDSHPEKVSQAILEIVNRRGKMQNPATESGGILLGRLLEHGPDFPLPAGLSPADELCPMVSLTLIPLKLKRILEIDMSTGQLTVEAQAILFASMPVVPLPKDLPKHATLAALDVAGAPAYAERYVKRGMRVLVVGGGGKSGLLTVWVVRQKLGDSGLLVALDTSEAACRRIRTLGVADGVVQVDARTPVQATQAVLEATGGHLVDLSINCASSPDTEMASILPTSPQGQVIFFNMATSFTKATLGAEGVGVSPALIMGNGYLPGHAAFALQCLRESRLLARFFAGGSVDLEEGDP
jgi:L-erythro-3,5-diaminohexanoate dehydrogenase